MSKDLNCLDRVTGNKQIFRAKVLPPPPEMAWVPTYIFSCVVYGRHFIFIAFKSFGCDKVCKKSCHILSVNYAQSPVCSKTHGPSSEIFIGISICIMLSKIIHCLDHWFTLEMELSCCSIQEWHEVLYVYCNIRVVRDWTNPPF